MIALPICLTQGFTRNFYADTTPFVLRIDLTLYTVFSYLAIFRLEEIGFSKLQEFAASQDPTKMFYFFNYLFNKVSEVSKLNISDRNDCQLVNGELF